MNRITFLIPMLAVILLVPASNAFAYEQYEELSYLEKIDLNSKQGKAILDTLGGYDKYVEFMALEVKTDLTDEINELNNKMADLGIMTLEEFNDPVKRVEFYLDHPEIVEIDNDNIHDVSYNPTSHGCSSCTQSVYAKMGYHYPFLLWTFDSYLTPTSWQNLYPNITYDFDNNDVSNEHDWIEPFSKSYVTQSGTYTLDLFASIDASPNYDVHLTPERYYTQGFVKTIDFPRYNHSIDSGTYIWGSTQWVNTT